MHLPQTGVLEVHREGPEHRQHQPVQALEAPQPDDVHLEEARHRAAEDLQRTRPPPLLVELRRSPLAVDLQFPPVLPERPERAVLERVTEHRERTGEIDFRMHLTVLVTRHVATEQTDHLVGPPAAAPDAATEEMVGPRNPVAVVPGTCGQEGQDLLPQLGCDALVRIDQKDPFVRRLGDRPVLLLRRVDVFMLQHARPELSGDGHGRVARIGVDDQDLVREAHRVETVAQGGLFVEGRDDDRQRRSPGAHPLRSLRASFCCIRS